MKNKSAETLNTKTFLANLELTVKIEIVKKKLSNS